MIKPVDEIPMTRSERYQHYRENIQTDINTAIRDRIPIFEFVGDYNFKTLANAARVEKDRICEKKVREIIRENEIFKGHYLSAWEFRRLYPIIISSVKGEKSGERRVFCRIDFENLDKLEELVIEAAKIRIKEIEQRVKEYEEKKQEADRDDFDGLCES